ncbi:hypothetical protein ACI65C_012125 [Semiaphis heraclei]
MDVNNISPAKANPQGKVINERFIFHWFKIGEETSDTLILKKCQPKMKKKIHDINDIEEQKNKTINNKDDDTMKIASLVANSNGNAKGESKVFNVDLTDESAEIRCVAFGAMVEKFYDQFEIQKIYSISNGILKKLNTNYNRLGHEFEILLNEKSEIKQIEKYISTIKKMEFEFIKLNNLVDVKKDQTIDVIGIIKNMGKVQTSTTAKGARLKRKEIMIIDDNKIQVFDYYGVKNLGHPSITLIISNIEEAKRKNTNIDVITKIGQIKETENITSVYGVNYEKKEKILIDENNRKINFNLWNEKINEFKGKKEDIIAIKNAKIGEYNHIKNLSLINSSRISINPGVPEATNYIYKSI